jgi:hypothetical protein
MILQQTGLPLNNSFIFGGVIINALNEKYYTILFAILNVTMQDSWAKKLGLINTNGWWSTEG